MSRDRVRHIPEFDMSITNEGRLLKLAKQFDVGVLTERELMVEIMEVVQDDRREIIHAVETGQLVYATNELEDHI